MTEVVIRAFQGVLETPYLVDKTYMMPNTWLGRNDTVPADIQAELIEAEAAGMKIERNHEEGILRVSLQPTTKEKTYNRVRAVMKRLDQKITPVETQSIDLPPNTFITLSKLDRRWECACGCHKGLSKTLITRKIDQVKQIYNIVTKTIYDTGTHNGARIVLRYIFRGLHDDVTLAENDFQNWIEGWAHCIPLLRQEQLRQEQSRQISHDQTLLKDEVKPMAMKTINETPTVVKTVHQVETTIVNTVREESSMVSTSYLPEKPVDLTSKSTEMTSVQNVPAATCLVFGANMSRLLKEAISSVQDPISLKRRLLDLIELAINDLDVKMTFNDRGCLLYGVTNSIDEALVRYPILEKRMVEIIELDLTHERSTSLSNGTTLESKDISISQNLFELNNEENQRPLYALTEDGSDSSEDIGFGVRKSQRIQSFIPPTHLQNADSMADAMAVGNNSSRSAEDNELARVTLPTPPRTTPPLESKPSEDFENGVDQRLEVDQSYNGWDAGGDGSDATDEEEIELNANDPIPMNTAPPPLTYTPFLPALPIDENNRVCGEPQNESTIKSPMKQKTAVAAIPAAQTPRSLLFLEADANVQTQALPPKAESNALAVIHPSSNTEPASSSMVGSVKVPSASHVPIAISPPAATAINTASSALTIETSNTLPISAPPQPIPPAPYYPYYPSHHMYGYPYSVPPQNTSTAAVSVPGTPMMHPMNYLQGFPLPSPALAPSFSSNAVAASHSTTNAAPAPPHHPYMYYPPPWNWPSYGAASAPPRNGTFPPPGLAMPPITPSMPLYPPPHMIYPQMYGHPQMPTLQPQPKSPASTSSSATTTLHQTDWQLYKSSMEGFASNSTQH